CSAWDSSLSTCF
nr:immunoglobulin light chain junction region [Macaca mulatta]